MEANEARAKREEWKRGEVSSNSRDEVEQKKGNESNLTFSSESESRVKS